MEKRVYKLFFGLAAGEAAAVALAMLADRILGWSGELTTQSKLAANGVGILGAFALALGLAAFTVWLAQNNQRISDIEKAISRSGRPYLLMAFAILLTLESLQDISFLLTSSHKPHLIFLYYSSYLRIFLPYFVWGALLGLQLLGLILPILRRQPDRSGRSGPDKRVMLFILMILVIFWLVVAFTDFGYIQNTSKYEIRRVSGRFLPVANPIMAHQVILVLLLLGLVKLSFSQVEKIFPSWPGDFISRYLIPILIWAAAYLVLTSVPVEPNYLVDMPAIPKGVIYPNSDAFYFAKESHRLTAGAGFESNSTHVMYSLFIAFLRMIGGEYYTQITTLQIAVVSCVPVLLYGLTRKISNQHAAFLVAILFIVREWNGLLMGEELAAANSNVFMSENLGLVGIIAFVSLMYSWVERPSAKRANPFIAGGVMGISLLIRADFAATMLMIGLLSLVLLWREKQEWFRGMVGMSLVIVVIIAPWIYRNYQVTGDLFLDKQNVMQKRISGYITQIFSPGDMADTQATQDRDSSDTKIRNLSTLANHFGNNLHQSFLYLPNTYQPGLDFGSIVIEGFLGRERNAAWSLGQLAEQALDIHTRSNSYYWFEWDGKESLRSVLPVASVLLVLALGISLGDKSKVRLNSILIGTLLAQSLIWAVPGFSGNRFIKTADWVTLIFFSIGISKLVEAGWKKLHPGEKETQDWGGSWFSSAGGGPEGHSGSLLWQYLLVGGLVLVGLSPGMMEIAIPERYSQSELAAIMENNKFADQESKFFWQDCVQDLSGDSEQEAYFGEAIYPRFYRIDEIHGNDRRLLPQDPNMTRIGFYLIGTENMGVLMADARKDQIIDHLTEVIVFGEIRQERFISGSCVFLVDRTQEIPEIEYLYSDPSLSD